MATRWLSQQSSMLHTLQKVWVRRCPKQQARLLEGIDDATLHDLLKEILQKM